MCLKEYKHKGESNPAGCMRIRSFLCLHGLLLQYRHETHRKLIGSFLDATLKAGGGTTFSTGNTFILLKSVALGSYTVLLQLTAADVNNVMLSDLRSTACFEASKTIGPMDSEMKHSV